MARRSTPKAGSGTRPGQARVLPPPTLDTTVRVKKERDFLDYFNEEESRKSDLKSSLGNGSQKSADEFETNGLSSYVVVSTPSAEKSAASRTSATFQETAGANVRQANLSEQIHTGSHSLSQESDPPVPGLPQNSLRRGPALSDEARVSSYTTDVPPPAARDAKHREAHRPASNAQGGTLASAEVLTLFGSGHDAGELFSSITPQPMRAGPKLGGDPWFDMDGGVKDERIQSKKPAATTTAATTAIPATNHTTSTTTAAHTTTTSSKPTSSLFEDVEWDPVTGQLQRDDADSNTDPYNARSVGRSPGTDRAALRTRLFDDVDDDPELLESPFLLQKHRTTPSPVTGHRVPPSGPLQDDAAGLSAQKQLADPLEDDFEYVLQEPRFDSSSGTGHQEPRFGSSPGTGHPEPRFGSSPGTGHRILDKLLTSKPQKGGIGVSMHDLQDEDDDLECEQLFLKKGAVPTTLAMGHQIPERQPAVRPQQSEASQGGANFSSARRTPLELRDKDTEFGFLVQTKNTSSSPVTARRDVDGSKVVEDNTMRDADLDQTAQPTKTHVADLKEFLPPEQEQSLVLGSLQPVEKQQPFRLLQLEGLGTPEPAHSSICQPEGLGTPEPAHSAVGLTSEVHVPVLTGPPGPPGTNGSTAPPGLPGAIGLTCSQLDAFQPLHSSSNLNSITSPPQTEHSEESHSNVLAPTQQQLDSVVLRLEPMESSSETPNLCAEQCPPPKGCTTPSPSPPDAAGLEYGPISACDLAASGNPHAEVCSAASKQGFKIPLSEASRLSERVHPAEPPARENDLHEQGPSHLEPASCTYGLGLASEPVGALFSEVGPDVHPGHQLELPVEVRSSHISHPLELPSELRANSSPEKHQFELPSDVRANSSPEKHQFELSSEVHPNSSPEKHQLELPSKVHANSSPEKHQLELSSEVHANSSPEKHQLELPSEVHSNSSLEKHQLELPSEVHANSSPEKQSMLEASAEVVGTQPLEVPSARRGTQPSKADLPLVGSVPAEPASEVFPSTNQEHPLLTLGKASPSPTKQDRSPSPIPEPYAITSGSPSQTRPSPEQPSDGPAPKKPARPTLPHHVSKMLQEKRGSSGDLAAPILPGKEEGLATPSLERPTAKAPPTASKERSSLKSLSAHFRAKSPSPSPSPKHSTTQHGSSIPQATITPAPPTTAPPTLTPAPPTTLTTASTRHPSSQQPTAASQHLVMAQPTTAPKTASSTHPTSTLPTSTLPPLVLSTSPLPTFTTVTIQPLSTLPTFIQPTPTTSTATHPTPTIAQPSTLSLTFQPTTVSLQGTTTEGHSEGQEYDVVHDDPLTAGWDEAPPTTSKAHSTQPESEVQAASPQPTPPPPVTSVEATLNAAACETTPTATPTVAAVQDPGQAAASFLTEASAHPLVLFEAPLPLHLAVTTMLYVYYSLNPWSYLAGLLAGFFIFYFVVLGVFILVVHNAEEALRKELHQQQEAQPVKHKAFEETKFRIKNFESKEFTVTTAYDYEMAKAVGEKMKSEVKLLNDFTFVVRALYVVNNQPQLQLTERADIRQCDVCLVPTVVAERRRRRWSKKYPIRITLLRGQHKELFLFSSTARLKEEWFRRLRDAKDGKTAEVLIEQRESFFQYIHRYFPPSTTVGEAGSIHDPHASQDGSLAAYGRARDVWQEGGGGARRPPLPPATAGITSGIRRDDHHGASNHNKTELVSMMTAGAKIGRNFSSDVDYDVVDATPTSSKAGVPAPKDTDWMNVFIARLCWDVWHEDFWKKWAKNRIQNVLSRVTTPSFMEKLQVSDVKLGMDTPVINRLVEGPILDPEGTWVYLDITYTGSFTMTIETKLKLTLNGMGEDTELQMEVVAPSKAKSKMPLADPLKGSSVDHDSDGNSDGEEGQGEEEQQVPPQPGPAAPPEHLRKRTRLLGMVSKVAKMAYNKSALVRKAAEKVSSYPLVLTVIVRRLDGVLAINIPPPPSDTIWVGFKDSPKLDLLATPQVGQKAVTISRVTRWIEDKLRELVKEKIVLPNMEDLVIPILNSGFPEDKEKTSIS